MKITTRCTEHRINASSYLSFIQNGGIFNNHSYKKREPAGVITDPAAREDRKRWMMLASRAKLPATAIAVFYQSKTILSHRRVD